MGKLQVMITPKETLLVRGIAAEVYRSYCPAGKAGDMTKDDLYHYGIIGLLEAKQKYDDSKRVPWLAFAAYRVRGAMLDQLRKQPMIRLPQARQKKVKELKAVKKELALSGDNADAEILADRLEWPVEEVHKISGMSPTFMPAHTDHRDREEGGVQGMILTDHGDNLKPQP